VKSCNGEYGFAGISADHVFATIVHGPDDPHVRSNEIHLKPLRSVDSLKIKKDTDTKSSKVCMTLLLRDFDYTFDFTHFGDFREVAEFDKCEFYYPVLGDGIARRVMS